MKARKSHPFNRKKGDGSGTKHINNKRSGGAKKVGILRETRYQTWVANTVLVKKKDGAWRMCFDFININMACLKDYYSLPEIDWKVDSLFDFNLKCLPNAYKGYHQIQMAKEDEHKMAFHALKGVYCYRKISFGLKNAGATYQRLVDKVFKSQIRRNMKAYVDDMPKKSRRVAKWIIELREHEIEFKPINVIKAQILADFLAKTKEEDEETDFQEQQQDRKNLGWKLYSDGALSGNGSEAGSFPRQNGIHEEPKQKGWRPEQVSVTDLEHLTKKVLVEKMMKKSIYEKQVAKAMVKEEDRAFLTVGLVGDWLTCQKRHGFDIPHFFEMAFHNFMKKPGQIPFFVRPTNQLVDVGSPSIELLRSLSDNEQVKSSSLSNDKGVSRIKLAVVKEGIPRRSASMAREGSKKRRFITESFKEEATVVKVMSKKKKLEVPRRMSTRGSILAPSVTVPKGTWKHPLVLARFVRSLANNSDSFAPDRLSFLSFEELVDVFDIHALQMAIVRNMLTNESHTLSQDHVELNNYLVSLKSKKSSLDHEMSKLVDRLAKAQRNHDVEGSQDFKDVQDYHPKAKEIFDGVAESFYKLEFPYISLLSGKAGQSLEELSVVEAPSIQETPST
uniref:Reverse transcriptase domain-containing protein n=1 Tax=Tanacetum cinerariifolium TaxID=118510 RepID=A0A6L2K8B3_TANCI|nr:reverse transcriptase domain-containing protein [Tanacetum cinerariifolium]